MYERILKCWDCRKDDVYRRAAQGGADRRPVTGDYKTDYKDPANNPDTETVKSEDQVGKEGEGGQATFGDF